MHLVLVEDEKQNIQDKSDMAYGGREVRVHQRDVSWLFFLHSATPKSYKGTLSEHGGTATGTHSTKWHCID